MQEIAKVSLDNEMDLILAHKRSMKLAELSGLSLSAQTSFATAVSEVARTSIESGKRTFLFLGIDSDHKNKYIVAALKNGQSKKNRSTDGLEYAKRLVNKYNIISKGEETIIELYFVVSSSFKFDTAKIDEWKGLFRNEPPVSPYEEIKRKNEQLQELSERIQESENQYRTLTNALPLIIFALNLKGELMYGNDWLFKFTGETQDALNKNEWKNIVHEDDYPAFRLLLKNTYAKGAVAIKSQCRLRHKNSSDYLWHQVSLTPFVNDKDELQYWIGYMADIHAQKVLEQTLRDNIELKKTQEDLEENQKTMESYIQELNRSNQELQQFAFVASHDLQEPVRKLLFYSDYLITKYTQSLDEKGLEYLNSMQSACQRMRNLIQDLLVFSQINRKELHFRKIDLNKIAAEALQDLEISIEEKQAQLKIEDLPTVLGDERMMRQLFENIISNALKYSKKGTTPLIEVGYSKKDGFFEIVFSDNGIGFDEKYLPQMFTLFQRLHSKNSYEGTGLGLAICKKVAEIHNGDIWAKAEEGKGATFFVSLPINQPAS